MIATKWCLQVENYDQILLIYKANYNQNGFFKDNFKSMLDNVIQAVYTKWSNSAQKNNLYDIF